MVQRIQQVQDMYSVVESELFFEESQAKDLEPGVIITILLMDDDDETPIWIPATVQGVTLSQISAADLNKMNEHLDVHSGNLWESGYFSNRKYSLTYADSDKSSGVDQEMSLYFIIKDVIGTPLDDASPSMDTTGMSKKDVTKMLKRCSQIEEFGPNAGELVRHKSCTGIAYDPDSKKVVVWREPTPNEIYGAPEHMVPSSPSPVISVIPRNKRRVISDEIDETLSIKRVRWPKDSKLEMIREIPGLDRQFREEYRACNTCVRGFTDFKGELINPSMPVGELLVNCVICLNDIITDADTKYRGMVNSDRAREMTQIKCFKPMAGTIARHPGLDVLVTNFRSDPNAMMSHQLRNDFMSILKSAFRFHGKTVTDHIPAGIPLERQLHLVRLKPHESVKKGTYGLKINQTGAPGDPVNYSSP